MAALVVCEIRDQCVKSASESACGCRGANVSPPRLDAVKGYANRVALKVKKEIPVHAQ
jgi:hypothetical protein